MAIFLTTALSCEAQPLVNFFRLKKQAEHQAFVCYRNEDIHLVVSGVGRLAMASACGYLAGCNQHLQQPLWLNVGVAGHAERPLGEALLANKVTEPLGQRSWYPVFVYSTTLAREALMTVDQPQTHYASNCLYDMEGSAFTDVATRFTSAELVHLFKVVSDNQCSGLAHINKTFVSELIETRLAAIETVLNSLIKVRSSLLDGMNVPDSYLMLVDRYKFSFSQLQYLRRQLQRCQSLGGVDVFSVVSDAVSAKDVLKRLDVYVDALAVNSAL